MIGSSFLDYEIEELEKEIKELQETLRALYTHQMMVRIGPGIYARTKKSSVNGKYILEKPLPELARDVLKKMGIEIVPTKAEIEYKEGRSNQVPTGRVIGVKSPVNLKIEYDGISITFLIEN